jgi:hypothetical protein
MPRSTIALEKQRSRAAPARKARCTNAVGRSDNTTDPSFDESRCRRRRPPIHAERRGGTHVVSCRLVWAAVVGRMFPYPRAAWASSFAWGTLGDTAGGRRLAGGLARALSAWRRRPIRTGAAGITPRRTGAATPMCPGLPSLALARLRVHRIVPSNLRSAHADTKDPRRPSGSANPTAARYPTAARVSHAAQHPTAARYRRPGGTSASVGRHSWLQIVHGRSGLPIVRQVRAPARSHAALLLVAKGHCGGGHACHFGRYRATGAAPSDSGPADSVIVRVRVRSLRACVLACARQGPRLSAQRTERVPHSTLRLAGWRTSRL